MEKGFSRGQFAIATLLGLSATAVSSTGLAQTAPGSAAKPNTSVTAPAPPTAAAPATAPAPETPATAATSTATPAPAPTGAAVPPVAPAPADAPPPPPYPTAPDTAEPPTDAATTEPSVDAASTDDAIYEPPLPRGAGTVNVSGAAVPVDATPLPPPPSKHVAPRSSLWVGARPGVFVPMGAMWLDGEPLGDVCCAESVRPFNEFASAGPSLSADVGVRFARHYQVFAFWEHGWLGSGSLEDAFGGQSATATSMFGGGFRFSTHPDAIGMVVEIALGYRTFEAEWATGTRLTAADDLFSTRLGFGAEWRLNRLTTLELLLVVGGGAFTDVEWTFADGTKRNALTGYDRYGQYIPFGIQLASHWDVISSND